MEGMRLRDPVAYEKLRRAKEYVDEAALFGFLHEKGYTAFTIPQLTIHEIVSLRDAEKQKQYEMEKQTRRRK